jgi:isopentenyldiphosphate isomerase
MNLKTEGIMEFWDVYDKFRRPKGFKIMRGGDKRLGKGEYHLTAHVCVFSPDGRMIVQRRADFKALWGGLWDISASGSVLAGESTGEGAQRELYEELGIKADLKDEQPRATFYHENCISDYFVVRADVPLEAVRLQKSEVAEVGYATRDEILAMIDDGRFIPYKKSFIEMMFDMNESKDRNMFKL